MRQDAKAECLKIETAAVIFFAKRLLGVMVAIGFNCLETLCRHDG